MSHRENPASDKRARPVAEAAWNVIREIAGEGTWDRRQCAEAAAYFAYLQGVAAGREAEVAARASEEGWPREELREKAFRAGYLAALCTTKEERDGT